MWAFGCILLEVKSRFRCLAGWTNDCENNDAAGPGADVQVNVVEKSIRCSAAHCLLFFSAAQEWRLRICADAGWPAAIQARPGPVPISCDGCRSRRP
jgi:hypothetical protein